MPVESLFIFLLIISGNFLAELFPCRFQKDLNDIIALKHIFGFLTLLFFVVLQTPLETFNLIDAFKNSCGLYVMFLLLINSHHITFIVSMLLLTISYILTLKIKENNTTLESDEDEMAILNTNNNIKRIQKYIHISIGFVILFGFLSYLGSKKSEYKKKFSYFTFIFGKTICANDGSKLSYMTGLQNSFS
jgi:hypothetical protein